MGCTDHRCVHRSPVKFTITEIVMPIVSFLCVLFLGPAMLYLFAIMAQELL